MASELRRERRETSESVKKAQEDFDMWGWLGPLSTSEQDLQNAQKKLSALQAEIQKCSAEAGEGRVRPHARVLWFWRPQCSIRRKGDGPCRGVSD